MPAIGGSDCSRDFAIAFLSVAAPPPRVNIATMTASNSATSGVPRKSSTVRTAVPSAAKMSARALPIISATGSSTVASVPTPAAVLPNPVVKLVMVSAIGRPAMAPTASEPKVRLRKGCTVSFSALKGRACSSSPCMGCTDQAASSAA
ncbi:hypothetical protein SAMN05216275_13415 [Streptosporangium canum]|uniref:Uncharacterized protein n=1 Tax=Streptosporangium canum TaxID=324952 RepID=A0A1I4C4E7_9ACTN|nr:hypothetical protein SAMN05216275_13415 [Streptosporangium canum]